jgi:hypothetical protein
MCTLQRWLAYSERVPGRIRSAVIERLEKKHPIQGKVHQGAYLWTEVSRTQERMRLSHMPGRERLRRIEGLWFGESLFHLFFFSKDGISCPYVVNATPLLSLTCCVLGDFWVWALMKRLFCATKSTSLGGHLSLVSCGQDLATQDYLSVWSL